MANLLLFCFCFLGGNVELVPRGNERMLTEQQQPHSKMGVVGLVLANYGRTSEEPKQSLLNYASG